MCESHALPNGKPTSSAWMHGRRTFVSQTRATVRPNESSADRLAHLFTRLHGADQHLSFSRKDPQFATFVQEIAIPADGELLVHQVSIHVNDYVDLKQASSFHALSWVEEHLHHVATVAEIFLLLTLDVFRLTTHDVLVAPNTLLRTSHEEDAPALITEMGWRTQSNGKTHITARPLKHVKCPAVLPLVLLERPTKPLAWSNASMVYHRK